ncbi:MAG: TonB family protein [Betaproteobacteria bacterium]
MNPQRHRSHSFIARLLVVAVLPLVSVHTGCGIGLRSDLHVAGFASAAPASGPSADNGVNPQQAKSMLDCAKLTDTSTKLRCFDRVKAQPPPAVDSNAPLPRSVDREYPFNQSRAAESERISPATEPTPDAPRSKKQPAEILSDYEVEVVRQLGKEMRPEEYPPRARERGIGGTVRALLRIGADGGITDATVASSSGNDELDRYVVRKLAALRLPPIPLELRARAFAVQIPVRFAIRTN